MKTSILTRAILLSAVAVHLIYGQHGQQENGRKRRGPERFTSTVSLKTLQRPIPGDTRWEVTVFLLTMNDMLQFIKTDSGYTAEYEISLTLRDDREHLVDTRVLNRKITVHSYAETNAKDLFQREAETFTLLPGAYTLRAVLDDRAASRPLKVEEEITVEGDIPEPIRLSDPLFFYGGKIGPDAFIPDSLTMLPVISRKHQHLYVSSELYLYRPKEDIQVIFSIYDSRNALVRRQTKTLSQGEQRRMLISGIPEALPFGQYSMTLTVTADGAADSVSGGFSVMWSEHTSARPDLTTAVQLMQYLISKKEFKELLQMDQPQQERFLERYWQKNDPDPATETNELQDEFYQRAAFTIAHFTTRDQEGWETDRGKIYILYGPPEHIERPVSRNGFEQYEIWDYPHLHKKFLFIDQNGTGHFTLQSESG
ncbi:GWxTD domain-containing protein [bacterium]|nr:GWxTD domain-containing protein [bacterium]